MKRKIRTIAERVADQANTARNTAGNSTGTRGTAGYESNFDRKRRESLEGRGLSADKLDGDISGQDKLVKYQKAGLHPKSTDSGYTRPSSTAKSSNDPTAFNTSAPKRFDGEESLNYRNRYLTWERNEARDAFNKTVETTKGVRNYSDRNLDKDRTSSFEAKSANLSTKTAANPKYTKLSANEKQLNEQYFQKTGQYLVDPTVSSWSGRKAIDTRQMTRKQKESQQSFGRKLNQMQSSIERGEEIDQSQFTDDEMPFLDNYLEYEQQQGAMALQSGRDKEGTNQLGDSLRELELELGLTDGQELVFDEEGNPQIKEDGTLIDPKERAIDKLKTERDDDIFELKEGYDLERARIENANRINGKITTQGDRQLAKLEREYLKNLKKTEDSWKDNIEDAMLNEDKKQFNIEARIDQLTDPQNIIKEANQQNIMRQARGLLNAGAATNWTGAISLAKTMVDTDRKNPTKAENFAKIDKKVFVDGFDRSTAFDTASTVLGYDATTAKDYLKSRGFTDKDISAQMADYQKTVLGYTDEQIKAEKDDLQIQDIIGKSPEELGEEELDFLQEYEIDHPKKAERWKMKIMNPEMTDAEIWNAVEEEFGKDKEKTISGAKNDLFNTKYEENIEAGMSEEEALKKANRETSSTFSTATAKSKSGGGSKDKETELSDNDKMRDVYREYLDAGGDVSKESSMAFLEAEFPEITNKLRERTFGEFTRYNASTQEYDSTYSSNWKEEERILRSAESGAMKNMTVSERVEFKKEQKKFLKTGKFVDGVFEPNPSVKDKKGWYERLDEKIGGILPGGKKLFGGDDSSGKTIDDYTDAQLLNLSDEEFEKIISNS